MRTLDAHWTATSANVAIWVYGLHVQAFHTDVEAALDACQWETAVEAAGLMLKEIAVAELALRGYTDIPFEADVHLALLAQDGPLLADMDSIPPPYGSDETTARQAADVAFEAERRLVGALPFPLPTLRTPEGFFPTLKIGSDLDGLRDALGLPKSFWRNWIP
ncbi:MULTISPECIES: hypothetical protein [unclassified Streptomyces]|uniref:hypothetical protein n=1 Tax=unclassified Streptomyces TaxID=2593676 RepID=UPI0004C29D0F|nr:MULTISPECIES: hypothetical protein [unclassified Streptomyces]